MISFDEGKKAWKDGLLLDDCPYEQGTLFYDEWQLGYDEADAIAEEENEEEGRC